MSKRNPTVVFDADPSVTPTPKNKTPTNKPWYDGMGLKGEWLGAAKAIGTGYPVVLIGPPGIGKTWIAHEYAKASKKGLFVQNMTLETLADSMKGHMVPNDRGGMGWMDGPVIAAMRQGGIVLINEVDHAGPDAQSFLHFVVDGVDVACVTLPNTQREMIRPIDGYQVIGTMNGTISDLPPALADRFILRVVLSRPNPAAVAKLPAHLHGFCGPRKTEEDPAKASPSLRALFSFANLEQQLGSEEAANLVFAHRAAEFLRAIELARR